MEICSGIALALVFGAAAILFLSMSLYLALLYQMTPLQAALTLAFAFIFMTGTAVLFTRSCYRRGKAELTAAVKASAMVAVAPPAARIALRHFRIVGILAATALAIAAARSKRA